MLSVCGDHEEELNVRLDIGSVDSVFGGEVRREPSWVVTQNYRVLTEHRLGQPHGRRLTTWGMRMGKQRVYLRPNTSNKHLLHYLLFDLLNNLINPLLNLLLFLFVVLAIKFLSTTPLLFCNVSLAPCAPCVPLVKKALAMSDKLCADIAFFCSIFLIECAAILTQVLANEPLLFLCKKTAGPRSPNELLKTIKNLLF